MSEPKNSESTTLLNLSASFSVHRVHNAKTGSSVIIKSTSQSQPSQKEISQLKNEYQILQEISEIEGVPKVFTLEVDPHRISIVMEDLGGQKLSESFKAGPLIPEAFLQIATQIVKIVSNLHKHNIVHCDLKPQNILFNPSTQQVHVIDFGCARRLIGRGQFHSETQGATLAYIAPEQTGRVNRRIDHRTDFYILGIAFYEMLSGRLPFEGKDTLEWVHAHIAKKATPLQDLGLGIPSMLGKIVEKMMSKAAEDRYQTGEGLLHDLEEVQKGLATGEPDTVFALGRKDFSKRFMLTQKVVGREREMKILKNYWNKPLATTGFALISGGNGSGKTALVREFTKGLSDNGGWVVLAKYDSRRTHLPFSALSEALNDLISQLQREPNRELEKTKTLLRQNLGESASALVSLAPLLTELLGPIEKMEEASVEETRARQQMAFKVFIKVLLSLKPTLTLFLDDWQFMDQASLDVLQGLLHQNSVPGFFILGAFNPEKLSVPLPSPHLPLIELKDLDQEAVMDFTATTLDLSPMQVADLAQVIWQKSGGNAYFMNQILKSFADEKLIEHVGESGWQWKLSAIQEREMPTSVVDLLISKVNNLSLAVRTVLQMASTFGTTFSLNELCTLNNLSEDENRKALLEAVGAGMIFPEAELCFRFTHERVREIIYQTLAPEKAREIHAKLGLDMLAILGPEEPVQKVYLAVSHLSAGLSLIHDRRQKLKIAELCLRAAQMARETAAMPLALEYTQCGLEAAHPENWQENRDLLFALYMIKVEAEYTLVGRKNSQKNFAYVQQHLTETYDQCRLFLLRIILLLNEGNHRDAVNYGILAMNKAGVRISKHPSKLALLVNVLRTKSLIKKGAFPETPSNGAEKEMTGLANNIMTATIQGAYFHNKPLMLMVVMQAIRRGYKTGVSRDNSLMLFYFSLFLAHRLGRYQEAQNVFETVTSLDRSYFSRRGRATLYFLHAAFLHPFFSPWSETISLLEASLQYDQQVGDLVNAGFSCLYISYQILYSRENLETVEPDLEKHLHYLQQIHNQVLWDSAIPATLFARLMQGKTQSDASFTSEDFNEEAYIQRLGSHSTKNPQAWYAVHKIMGLCFFGHYTEAEKLLPWADSILELMPFALSNLFYESFSSLLQIELARLNNRKLKASERRKIQGSLKKIRVWSQSHRRHFVTYFWILQAELQAIQDKPLAAMASYEKAVEAAVESGSWMASILVNEKAASFYRARGQERIAYSYSRDAVYSCRRWGATRKADHLLSQYPKISKNKSSPQDSFNSSTTESVLNGQLDMQTAAKASLALSSELNMQTLLDNLMHLMIENTGAERGILLLIEKEEPVVKNHTGYKDVDYPRRLIQHVQNSSEEICFDDGRNQDQFISDPYFKSQQPLSILCVPIKHQSEIKGLLYLENNSSTGVFTADRLGILRIILAQAAVSIENARLYSEVAEKARMASELRTAKAVQETLFPPEENKLRGLHIRGHYEPASECGGDWWYYHEQEGKIFVYIGDATGHGASAALVTSAARSAVSLFSTLHGLTPAKAMELLNRAIFETSKGSMNMTFLICAIDLNENTATFCNASHEPPLVISSGLAERSSGGTKDPEKFKLFKEGIYQEPDLSGPRLGQDLNSNYQETKISYHPGDLLVLTSDGLCDMSNPGGKDWGSRRFLKAVYESLGGNYDARSLITQIKNESDRFRESAPLRDDVTLVACYFEKKGLALKQAA